MSSGNAICIKGLGNSKSLHSQDIPTTRGQRGARVLAYLMLMQSACQMLGTIIAKQESCRRHTPRGGATFLGVHSTRGKKGNRSLSLSIDR